MDYIIGNVYWVHNPKAGKNMQSPGKLISWVDNTIAMLYNERWDILFADIENLNKHNEK